MLESRKFSSISFQNTRNDECPRGVNFRILALGGLYPHRWLKVLILHNICTCGYLYRRGLRVVVLRKKAMREPQAWERHQRVSTLFLCRYKWR